MYIGIEKNQDCTCLILVSPNMKNIAINKKNVDKTFLYTLSTL